MFCANWAPKFFRLCIATNFFQNYRVATQVKFPDIFHWKSAIKGKWMWSMGQNFGQIKSNAVNKTPKKLAF